MQVILLSSNIFEDKNSALWKCEDETAKWSVLGRNEEKSNLTNPKIHLVPKTLISSSETERHRQEGTNIEVVCPKRTIAEGSPKNWTWLQEDLIMFQQNFIYFSELNDLVRYKFSLNYFLTITSQVLFQKPN